MIQVGDRARDKISRFTGIVVARTEWLNKCVRLTIQPEELKDGKPIDNHTFDEEQVELVDQGVHSTTKARQTGGPSIAPTRNADPT